MQKLIFGDGQSKDEKVTVVFNKKKYTTKSLQRMVNGGSFLLQRKQVVPTTWLLPEKIK